MLRPQEGGNLSWVSEYWTMFARTWPVASPWCLARGKRRMRNTYRPLQREPLPECKRGSYHAASPGTMGGEVRQTNIWVEELCLSRRLMLWCVVYERDMCGPAPSNDLQSSIAGMAHQYVAQ